MLKVGLIILAFIGLVGTTTHYAFANNMGGPAMGSADTGGGGGGGSMGSSDTTTSPTGSAGPSDNSQSNTATESPPPHVGFPEGWLAGNEKYGGPSGYDLWKAEHHHHLWGSNLWLDQRLRNQAFYWNKYMDQLPREHIHHNPAVGPSAEEMDPFAWSK